MLKIIQITDLHLNSSQELVDDIDVWANFDWVLAKVAKKNPDLLVITGDLCLDVGEKETYLIIKSLLDTFSVPYYLVAGNHDSPTLMAEVFGYELEKGKLKSYRLQTQIGNCHFWDSSDGFLQENLLDTIERNDLIFVHHPLVLGTSKFMDENYALQNIKEINSKLRDKNTQNHFFHGHYHCDSYTNCYGHSFYITPSTYYQLDTKSYFFKKATKKIAYREINWEKEKLQTEVVWNFD